MNIKKGDNVRFLNAVGGGVVSRIDEKKRLIYVEDEDGFEIPTLENDCVVIGEVNKETNFIKKDFSAEKDTPKPLLSSPVAERSGVRSEPVFETPEGEFLRAFLAFFPLDIKQLQTTSYDCYLLNDSNYFLYYNVINGENDRWKSIANGLIEPNTQELLTEIAKDQLSSWERIRVQLIPFKQDKNYTPQAAIDAQLRINAVKFYKLHSFTENDYFDEPAMMIDIVREVENELLIDVPVEEIKQALYTRNESEQRPRLVKKTGNKEKQVIEIDLHIHELVDTTAGMSNGDMLQLQLDKFHAVLEEHKNHRGQKIVFIHGKGEGVLRTEIEKQLKTRYKNYYFQDASFREYGFGATMVTIK